MIIGAKRKYGMYENYIEMSSPVQFIAVYKNAMGKWQIWEMINSSAGQPIGAYGTKKQTIEEGRKIALECKLPFRM